MDITKEFLVAQRDKMQAQCEKAMDQAKAFSGAVQFATFLLEQLDAPAPVNVPVNAPSDGIHLVPTRTDQVVPPQGSA